MSWIITPMPWRDVSENFGQKLCVPIYPIWQIGTNPLMVPMGIRYGKGLQLVNILRDIPQDLRNGRCYIPLSFLGEVGASSSGSIAWRELC